MASDFNSLGQELGRLEIEPTKAIKKETIENPFLNSSQKRNKYSESIKCSCMVHKRKNNKKKPKEILRDPLLRLSQPYCKNISKTNERDNIQVGQPSQNSKPDLMCLHSLVNTCNLLSISSEKKHVINSKEPKDHNKWWMNRRSKALSERSTTKVETEKSSSSTCSQQALNPPPPCDVTIDELASYFETFVHIPKKMSTMAEMMYI